MTTNESGTQATHGESGRATGGPAFPIVVPSEASLVNAPGMMLRDYFAGQALAGEMATQTENAYWPGNDREALGRLAAKCYNVANAMLAARAHSPAQEGR